MGLCNEAPTQDALGFGHSFAAAANNALKHWGNQKRLAEEQRANPKYKAVQDALSKKAAQLNGKKVKIAHP